MATKDALMIAIGKMKPKGMPADDDDLGGGEEHTAMTEFLDAVRSKDVDGALDAFKLLCELCYSHEEKEDEDDGGY